MVRWDDRRAGGNICEDERCVGGGGIASGNQSGTSRRDRGGGVVGGYGNIWNG